MAGNSECVVIVHGLWMHDFCSIPLARHLHKAMQCPVHRFDYPSLAGHLDDNSQKLQRYCESLACDTVHLVGHSLGGVVFVNMLNKYPLTKTGRGVAIGSPLAGTLSGRRLQKIPLLKRLLGHSLSESMAAGPMQYTGAREIGVITATRGLGLGQILGRLEKPHDGIVQAAETALPGASEHVQMPTQTHTSSYYSKEAAQMAATFLRTGHFRAGFSLPV